MSAVIPPGRSRTAAAAAVAAAFDAVAAGSTMPGVTGAVTHAATAQAQQEQQNPGKHANANGTSSSPGPAEPLKEVPSAGRQHQALGNGAAVDCPAAKQAAVASGGKTATASLVPWKQHKQVAGGGSVMKPHASEPQQTEPEQQPSSGQQQQQQQQPEAPPADATPPVDEDMQDAPAPEAEPAAAAAADAAPEATAGASKPTPAAAMNSAEAAAAADAAGSGGNRDAAAVSSSQLAEAPDGAAAAAAAAAGVPEGHPAPPASPLASAEPSAASAPEQPKAAAAAAVAASSVASHAAPPAAAAAAVASAASHAAAGESGGAPLPEEYNAEHTEADRARVAAALERYRERVQRLTSERRAKPDMIAYSQLKEELTPAPRHGHVAGIPPGFEMWGRGEMAILGLHSKIVAGIDSAKDVEGAYAICMSGGYKDDEDEGAVFWYTGEGGQGKAGSERGKQVSDQEFTRGNLALQQSHDKQRPVRVFRSKAGEQRRYVYEGLYWVVEAVRKPSRDGPLVCKFKMQGVPGHHLVTSQVTFGHLRGKRWQYVSLAAPEPRTTGERKRARAGASQRAWPTKAQVKEDISARAAAGGKERLVCEDISDGKENLPIPAWNAVDDEAPPGESEGFTYVTEYQYRDEEAQGLAQRGDNLFYPESEALHCGLQVMGGEYAEGLACPYTSSGLLQATHPYGVVECDDGCAATPHCKHNRVVAQGLRVPLELFKTVHKGWGVRAACDLLPGTMICQYLGMLVTDKFANELRGMDAYLFDLDHFHEVLGDTEQQSAAAAEGGMGPPPPHFKPMPPDLQDEHLVVDAGKRGNVARFINHSCNPNCLVQTVLTGNARNLLLYYCAIVAQEPIKAGTELTYNYWYQKRPEQQEAEGAAAGGEGDKDKATMICHCGAANCVGRLR